MLEISNNPIGTIFIHGMFPSFFTDKMGQYSTQ